MLFVEGAYNQRLDIITDPDIPAGTTVWMFDQTDIREAKKRLARLGMLLRQRTLVGAEGDETRRSR